jgi:hypothetical protein
MLAKSGRKGKPKDFMARIRDFDGRRAITPETANRVVGHGNGIMRVYARR